MALTDGGHSGRFRPVVGMFTQDLLELYAEQWLGAVAGARDHGCDLITFCGRALDAPGFAARANAIYDLVTADTVDGLVIWSSLLGVHVGPRRLAEFTARFAGLPIVSVEEPLGGAPTVLTANRQGMRAAVRHLIEAHGRTRIGFVRGAAHHVGARERYQGYQDALRDHGLTEDPALVSDEPPSWLPETAAVAVAAMLRSNDPPDAIAAANDDFAVAVLSALAEGGRTDVSVVGFDDVTNVQTHDLGFDTAGPDSGGVRRAINLSTAALSLTTVHAPFQEMGRRAVELAAAMIRGEPVPDMVLVPADLVVRRSCGCRPARPDPAVDARTDPRRILSERSAGLPDGWPDRLVAALTDEAHGRASGTFGRLLDGLVQQSTLAGENVENWWRVLAALRARADADAGPARTERVVREAELLLTETTSRHWRYAQVLTDKRNQIVRDVGQRLITAADVMELAATLAAELPKLGIPGCYLVAYRVDGTARLLLAYENGAAVPVDDDVFDPMLLVPGGRLHRPVPSDMVALPLSFQDQQLGYALLELGPSTGWIYAALGEQLSSALHRAFLVERERAAQDALEQAHRREERHRLAAELHDSVSQALFSMTLQTRALELAVRQDGATPDSQVARGLAELRGLTQGALAEMRALILQLRPVVLREEGLGAAIRRHCAAVAARVEFEIHVEAPEDRLSLDEDADQELFRIVQEALHNCVKHAAPRRVDVRLVVPTATPDTLVLEIVDDGIGFDPDLPRPGHLGLTGMRERAERLGGRFTVDSAPGKPTTVRVALPGAARET